MECMAPSLVAVVDGLDRGSKARWELDFGRVWLACRELEVARVVMNVAGACSVALSGYSRSCNPP